jgi:uncharacterized membrane protein
MSLGNMGSLGVCNASRVANEMATLFMLVIVSVVIVRPF